MIPLLIVLSAVAPVLGVPPLCRRLAAGIARLLALLVTNFTEARKKLSERARLRVAAALLDLGGQLARLRSRPRLADGPVRRRVAASPSPAVSRRAPESTGAAPVLGFTERRRHLAAKWHPGSGFRFLLCRARLYRVECVLYNDF